LKKFLNFSAYFLIVTSAGIAITGTHFSGTYSRWIEVPRSSGVNGVFVGLVILLAVKKYYKGKKEPIEYSKCPNCGESYFYSKLSKGICPTCNVATIDLNKYYEKHN